MSRFVKAFASVAYERAIKTSPNFDVFGWVARVLSVSGFEGADLVPQRGLWRGELERSLSIQIVIYESDFPRFASAVRCVVSGLGEDTAIAYTQPTNSPIAVYGDGRQEEALPPEGFQWSEEHEGYVPVGGPSWTWIEGDGIEAALGIEPSPVSEYSAPSPEKYESPSSGYKPTHGGYPES